MAGKTIIPAQAKVLLEKGETGTSRGSRSKTGKTFGAKLRLDRATGRVEFVFEDRGTGGKRRVGGG